MVYLQHPWASGKAGKIPLGTLYGHLDPPCHVDFSAPPAALTMPLVWTPFLYPPDFRGDGY